jgi:hypothetical protein
LKLLVPEKGARLLAVRAVAFVCAAVVLASCGDDVDVCSRPGGECPPPQDFSVDFFVESPGRFGALQIDVVYLGDRGGFIGTGDQVDCVPLVEAIVASNSLGERLVKIGLISLQGINTPASIIRCGFRTSEELTPRDFDIEVRDASDTDSRQIDPPPSVVVKSIFER